MVKPYGLNYLQKCRTDSLVITKPCYLNDIKEYTELGAAKCRSFTTTVKQSNNDDDKSSLKPPEFERLTTSNL